MVKLVQYFLVIFISTFFGSSFLSAASVRVGSSEKGAEAPLKTQPTNAMDPEVICKTLYPDGGDAYNICVETMRQNRNPSIDKPLEWRDETNLLMQRFCESLPEGLREDCLSYMRGEGEFTDFHRIGVCLVYGFSSEECKLARDAQIFFYLWRSLIKIFEIIDANGDGIITPEELANSGKRLCSHQDDLETFNRWFKRFLERLRERAPDHPEQIPSEIIPFIPQLPSTGSGEISCGPIYN